MKIRAHHFLCSTQTIVAKLIVLGFCLVGSSATFGQIADRFVIVPASPTTVDQITLVTPFTMSGLGCERAAGKISMSQTNNTIDILYEQSAGCGITFGAMDCLGCEWNHRIGPLPAGNYTLRIVLANGTIWSSQPLVVAPATSLAQPGPRHDYGDSYWVPQESGWGLHLLNTQSRLLVGTLFVYDEQERPTWYLMGPGAWQNEKEYSSKIYRTSGSYFGSTSFQSKDHVEVGTIALRFRAWNNGIPQLFVTYNIGGVTKSFDMMRQSF